MRFTIVIAILLFASSARAEDVQIAVLPGASAVIDPSLSASRDTFALSYQVTPLPVLTAGGDVALVGLRRGDLELRFGFLGMLELQHHSSIDDTNPKVILPTASGYVSWRGRTGLALAVSSRAIGRALGGTVAEVVLSDQHESAHPAIGEDPAVAETVIVGDFARLELGVRHRFGRWRLDTHVQASAFHPAPRAHYRFYDAGLGFDVALAWERHPRVHPFTSVHADRMWGRHDVEIAGYGVVDVPDWYNVRQLAGVSLPGIAHGSIQIYAALEIGHGHSLLAFQERLLVGGGVRLTLLGGGREAP